MSDTILAIIELDNFPQQVAARSAWLASKYGYDLTLVLSDPTLAVLGTGYIVSSEAKEVADRIKATQQQVLDELAAASAAKGIEVTTEILDERPAGGAISALVERLKPAIVVKGTHYHSAAARAIFADVDWQLIRRLDCTLWLVKQDAWQDKPTIVAAVDPTHAGDKAATLDQKIVDAAKTIADASGGNVHLLHTYQRLKEIGSKAMWTFKPVKLEVEELQAHMRDEHQAMLGSLAADNGIPSDHVHQMPGRADEILPSFARTQGASLVVMGAIARSGLKRRIIGSTAERVLDHLHCDVLIVRSD
jgi:universal stress protein E